MTRHHQREHRALQALFGELLDRVGGVHAAAAALHYPASHLSEAANLAQPGRGPRADHVAELEAIAGEPLVTAQLARMAGCTLLPLPHAEGNDGAALAAVLRNAGELGGQVAAALSDGRLSAEERAALVAGCDTLGRAVAHARAVLAAGLGGEEGR